MSLPALAQSAQTSDSCTRISPAVLDSYANEIGEALRWATIDANNNGTSGQYAVAARNSRDLLQRAQQRATTAASALRHADPSVTTYAEAGNTKEHVRAILEVVPEAAHWSIISSLYHQSSDAEKAFDEAVVVLQRGNVLYAAAGRCYMGLSSPQKASTSPTPTPLYHFSLDSPDIEGDAKLYVKKGNAAPIAVSGPTGRALYFTGAAAVATPFNLDSAQYPQTTVTAWVKRDGDSKGSRSILSTGSDSGILLGVNSTYFTVKAGPTSVTFSEKMPIDEWVFVAGVVDLENGWTRLHQNDGVRLKENLKKVSKPPRLHANPDNPDADRHAYLFVGARQFSNWQRSEALLAIDDVRVYGGALTVEQINAIRAETTPSGVEIPITSRHQEGESRSTNEILQEIADQTRRPEITYGSEEEAQAAADRRAREQGQAELDREQNELEAQSRSTSSDGIESRPVGDPTFTSVVGTSGDFVDRIDLQNAFLTKISITTAGNAPCMINANEEALQLECMDDNIFGHIAVELPDAVISRIEICEKGDHHIPQITGLKVWGTIVTEDGRLIAGPGGIDTAMNARCNTVFGPSTILCDGDTVGTGLVVHSVNTYPGKSISGLQLICRAVGVD